MSSQRNNDCPFPDTNDRNKSGTATEREQRDADTERDDVLTPTPIQEAEV
jgi:hypothetical protein